MQKLPGSTTLALVICMSIAANVNSATKSDFTNNAAAPQSVFAVHPQEGAASPDPAGILVAQSTGQSTVESLQQKLEQNPFLKRFGVNLTALDLTDGFAMIEVTEGPQAIIEQVAAGIDIADIELKELPSNKDRQTVVAMRKVLDSVMKREQLVAIMLVAQPVPAEQGVAKAAPAAAEQPSSTSADGSGGAPADASASEMNKKTLVMNIQRRLNELGYDAGPADGVPGRGTGAAIREYQTASAIAVNGKANKDLLKHMNSSAAVPRPAEPAPTTVVRRSTGKPVVGVAEFTNEATGTYWWGGGVGWELSGMLSNELANTGEFRVVERAKLEPVLLEQDLAASGRIRKGTGAKIGMVTGAEYLVLGTVTSFESNTASTGGGVSFAGISIGGKKKEAYIAVDLRVVNSTTGELDFVRTVEARSKGGGLSLGLFKSGFGGKLASEKRTPAGKAIRAVIVEITDYLACAMVGSGDCMAEYNAKEKKRRKKLKSSVSLD